MKALAILAIGVLAADSASAADETAAVMGYGVATCAQFAQDYQINTAVENSYFNWAQGFMSALNLAAGMGKGSTRDLNALRTDDQKAYVRTYCSSHPLDEFQ